MLQLEAPPPMRALPARGEEVAAAPAAHSSAAATLPHHPALDGLRGLAVVAVLGYHLGWLPGGFLGVSLFFTLSGYLITNLLLAERRDRSSIALNRFWARRARRLLPAALTGIALAVVVTVATGTGSQLRRLPGDTLGALTYGANWRFVFDYQRYQAVAEAPSALQHYWSLAIEEQVYLLLPLVMVALTLRRLSRRRVGAALVVLLVASALAMLATHDATRGYFGTDARAFEVLVGALLAVVIGCPPPATAPVSRPRRPMLTIAALAAADVTAVLWVGRVAETDHWLYRGGLWAVGLLSALLIAGAVRTAPLARALAWRPAVALGVISYGVYVYHWPLFLLLTSERTGLHGLALAGVRVGTTIGLATLSYRVLELPIRRGAIPTRTALGVAGATALVLVGIAVVGARRAPTRDVAGVRAHPVVLVAASAPVEAPIVRPTTPAHPTTTAAPAPPLRRVLFMGDSLVHQPLATFSARLAIEGVSTQGVGGAGQSLLSNGNAEIAALQRAVASFDPDVVVLESCCGPFATDGVASTGAAAGGAASAGLWAQWRRVAAEATRVAASRGAVVLWVLGPPLHTNGWYGAIDDQVAPANSIYRSLARCVPGAGVIDWGVVGGLDGSFVAFLRDDAGNAVRIRTADGFHFTPAGWDLLARITLPQINRQWEADGGRRSFPVTAACLSG